jgi:hypothetical protein
MIPIFPIRWQSVDAWECDDTNCCEPSILCQTGPELLNVRRSLARQVKLDQIQRLRTTGLAPRVFA